jgi:hypothetical protein
LRLEGKIIVMVGLPNLTAKRLLPIEDMAHAVSAGYKGRARSATSLQEAGGGLRRIAA